MGREHIVLHCPNKSVIILRENDDIETKSKLDDDNALPSLMEIDG